MFFAALAAGKTYSRQTDLGFVVPFPHLPRSLLRFRPRWGWSGRNRVLNPTVVELDLAREWVDWRGKMQRTSLLELVLNPGGVRSRLNDNAGVPSAQLYRQVVEEVRTFLADPGAAFARSSDSCGCCGKELTDPVSQGRGIGPECAKRLAYLRWVYTGQKGDPPALSSRKPRRPRDPQGKIVHSNEDGTVLEYNGPATIVQHCAVLGELKTPVRWFETRPPERYAQHETTVTVWFKHPGKRASNFFRVVPDNIRYMVISDAAGEVLWDSRRLVPCDMAVWDARREEHKNDRWEVMSNHRP
jgi:hypothetical protein